MHIVGDDLVISQRWRRSRMPSRTKRERKYDMRIPLCDIAEVDNLLSTVVEMTRTDGRTLTLRSMRAGRIAEKVRARIEEG